ncbi:hypothetical protein H6G20_03610 [Desertifilum sp. FACHB-1129]|uniref:Uncharacterized protein n=2 Tax=Desertifilum tharense IPPAS B-1220 TaxID=1781255 RepID=A0ACD5GWI8_9CYAN|nr:hypothetical protein [Desertifilum tharense]MBD2310766.1 hypothetical protein [Desertifilum sp. FACHB-1129]MBD2320803.1 hypothetical protein [Desertifilum sp. FACHB-866]MBD2330931.1 hypothetical protein [Desertifilum sp. FACHB-868]MCD8485404.1 hypothetical protein [Desertifilum sp.]MDA0209743.1 hypothetical protein [Cyanobacteria bacterium FC1]MDI9637061.1 hypothetical protein [Geitlerinema splendidum]
MKAIQKYRQGLIALVLTLVMFVATACGTTNTATNPQLPAASQTAGQYQQLERGDTPAGQNFGDWVVRSAGGLISDAYVRDNDKLGVVITSQVRPNEVRPLARSLVEGFRKNFTGRDLSVLMYAPDKKLILTANYDHRTNQIEYQ